MVVEVNVSWSEAVAPHKLVITSGSLILLVSGQHALYAHADTLYVLYGTPALVSEKIQADNAVGVYVGMHWDRSLGCFHERDLRRFNRILLGEFKLESVDLVAIQRIVVEDPNIHMPLLEVVGGYEVDARR